MKKKLFRDSCKLFYMVLFFWYFANPTAFPEARANDVLVAVASNFHNPFREIIEQFERITRHKVQIVSGSTGKLYAQIINGAPFELFIAADKKRPRLLRQNLKAVSNTQFTYAIGKITLWSPNLDAISEDGKSILYKKNFKHIAMANPITAPYGKAALQALKKLGLLKKLQPLIVQGENINQVFQFIFSQNAELGIVSLSQVLDPKNNKKGKRAEISSEYYDPIKQDIVILTRGKNNTGAMSLWRFLKSDQAKRIIKKYGYELS